MLGRRERTGDCISGRRKNWNMETGKQPNAEDKVLRTPTRSLNSISQLFRKRRPSRSLLSALLGKPIPV